MGQVLKIEIKKAFKNKMFFMAILIGIIIAIVCFGQNFHTYAEWIKGLDSSGEDFIQNPLLPMFSLYNEWIGGESYSLGTSIYFFVFPLLISIPYGWSYCSEKKSGYRRMVVTKVGKKKYLCAKYIAVFLSGGVAMAAPMIFNFMLTAAFIPAICPLVEYDTAYGVFVGSLMSTLYYTKPLLYVMAYILVDFVYCGIFACITMALATFIKQKWIVVIAPFFVALAIDFSTKYIYTSSDVIYYQVSPFYFLRGIETGYAAAWYIIIGQALAIFVITALIGIVLESRHEVY